MTVRDFFLAPWKKIDHVQGRCLAATLYKQDRIFFPDGYQAEVGLQEPVCEGYLLEFGIDFDKERLFLYEVPIEEAPCQEPTLPDLLEA